MRGRSLLILALVVAALGAFILLWERRQPTTGEREERSDLVFGEFAREEVAALEVHDGEHVRLERRPDGWHLTSPLAWRADEQAVGGALTALLDLRAQRTLASGEVDPAEYGLDEPQLEVVVESVSGERHRLAVGEAAALGSTRAVTRDGRTVYLVPSWFTSDLEREVDAWRSRDLLEVSAADLERLTVETPSDRVEVVREGELWRLLAPVDDLADRDHVRELIADLNALRVVAFAGPGDEPAALGFEPPRYRVVLQEAGETEPTVVELGATREVDGATQVAARRPGIGVLWVDDRPEIRLSRAPVTWRSRVLYPFDSWDVGGLSLSRGAETVALTRVDGVWQSADGTPADAAAILERLTALAELEASAWGLAPPQGEPDTVVLLELHTGDGSGERTRVGMRFYQPRPGADMIVTVDGRPGAMAVPADALMAVTRDLGSLQAD